MLFKVSEYEVQKESKVLDTLETLPNYSVYVSKENKKLIEYGFWSRSTIPWKLSCEADYPRESVVDAANFEKEKEALNESTVIWVNTIAYSAGFVATAVFVVLFITGTCSKVICESVGKCVTACCLSV